jgi:sec-independent protein translocase protein TatB
VFSFGTNEIIIIGIFALLLFGPDKIPQFARTLGRFMREFNKYKDIMQSTIRMEIYQSEGPEKPTMTVEERIAKAGAASTELLKSSGADVPPVGEADAGAAPAEALPTDEADAGAAPAVASVTPPSVFGETEKEDRG